MQLPFSKPYVKNEMCGPTYVLSTMEDGVFRPVSSMEFKSDGLISVGGDWNTRGGTLNLNGEDEHLWCFFSGLQTLNGSVFALGKDVRTNKVVYLHKRVLLVSDQVGVCVSTHIGYEKARDNLLKSLARSFSAEDIVVVESGHTGQHGTQGVINGSTHVRVAQNRLGFTGLEALDPDAKPYWLLLHDTCEAESNLGRKLDEIDVGLNPDMVLFEVDKERLELGLYRSSFIKKTKDVMRDKAGLILGRMMESAVVTVSLDVSSNEEAERDVYGTGIKRRVISMPKVGIKKFRGRRAAGGRP